MKNFVFLALILALVVSADKYALIIGSADGWSNYSITSDPCRAYDLMIDSGIDASHIIMMLYSSNFNYYRNPFPGKIFTDPSDGEGIDYAAKCASHIDYDGSAIIYDIIPAILQGKADYIEMAYRIQNPRVFHTNKEDTIFMYFMDHGDKGVVYVGESEYSEYNWYETFNYMKEFEMYKEIVIYMEACYSGSMFGRFPAEWNIYAFSSADADHPALMSNCPPFDKVNGKSINACMSGLYDNAWLSFVEQSAGNATLSEVFKYVDESVRKVGSDQGISQWGSVEKFANYPINRFIGDKLTPSNKKLSMPNPESIVSLDKVPRHVATWKAIRASEEDLEQALKELSDIVIQETKRDITMMRIARAVTNDDVLAEKYRTLVSNSYDDKCVASINSQLIKKCHFTTPFSIEMNRMVRNICSNKSASSISIDEFCL
ncbi:hypothetical protein WA158_005011 [Blastocystis sp. Blastoise]